MVEKKQSNAERGGGSAARECVTSGLRAPGWCREHGASVPAQLNSKSRREREDGVVVARFVGFRVRS